MLEISYVEKGVKKRRLRKWWLGCKVWFNVEDEKVQQRLVEKSTLQPLYQAWELQRCSRISEPNRSKPVSAIWSAEYHEVTRAGCYERPGQGM